MPTPDLRLANDLRIACQHIARRIRYESTLDVAPHQYSVLVHLDAGPLTLRDLADRERVSPPSMTRTVNALEDAGLVARAPHPTDGRQVLVDLTTTGRDLLARTRASRDTWMMRRLDALDADDRAALAAALPALRRMADR